MAKQDICDLIAQESREKNEKKVVPTQRSARFNTVEEKVTYIFEQNRNSEPGNVYFRGFDPIESYLVDTMVSERAAKYTVASNSKDDALKKTILIDALTEITGERRSNYDTSRMSMKQFSQYFALQLVESAMDHLIQNPSDVKEKLLDALVEGGHRSQINKDPFHSFRRPSPLSEMAADRYLSLFKFKDTKEQTINAKNMYDLKYILVTDIYCINAAPPVQAKALEYLQKGQTKKAAAYVVLQSIKEDLFF